MSDKSDLESLREHWGSAYWIRRGPVSGHWIASRRGAPLAPSLRAITAHRLRELIRADYRPAAGGEGDVVRLPLPATAKTTRVPPARSRGSD